MKIKLTIRESEKIFFDSLCNGALGCLFNAGIELVIDNAKYDEAKKVLKEKSTDLICIEDVYMQMLRMGYTLDFVDCEGEYDAKVTLEKVHKRVSKIPTHDMLDIIEFNDDAMTAYRVLQTVLYEEIIFD